MNEVKNKKEYEMSYLLTPEIPDDKTDPEVAEIKKIITENNGDIIQTDPLEKKRLAYPVKKQNYAYLGIVYFNIDKENLDKIKKTLALYKKVIRYLILNKPLKPKPKPKMVAFQPSTEMPAPTPTFDQKLESILKG